jgi:hypothetical protein
VVVALTGLTLNSTDFVSLPRIVDLSLCVTTTRTASPGM